MSTPYSKIPQMRTFDELFSLKKRAGVITGGAGKMGQEFARTFLGAGANVVLADLDEKRCVSIAKELSPGARGIGCNVADQGDTAKLFDFTEKEFGRLDFLVCNVMSKPEGYYKDFDSYSLETWQKVLDGNLTGAFLACREASRRMKDGGTILLTSSIYGMVGPDQRIYRDCSPVSNPYGGSDSLNCPAAYSASKAGLLGLSKHLATLLAPKGIRVNVLTPGGVYDGQEKAFHDAYVERTPLGRMAVWSDYNGAALFLVSDASRYMTGQNLVLDGGWTAW